MASSTVPERIARAVELLDLAPDDDVLELGCGVGLAVPLLAKRVARGSVTALDRSPTAVARARERLAAAGGVAEILHGSVADAVRLLDGRRFTVVFAVNLNVFWTKPDGVETRVVRDLLAPGGRLHLFFDAPSPDRTAEVTNGAARAARDAGFTVVTGGDALLGWIHAE